MRKITRNAPCPCGSGRKYKGCCEVSDRSARSGARGVQRQRESLLDLERETCQAILAWARLRGERDPMDDCPVEPDERQMSVPWAAYDTGLVEPFLALNDLMPAWQRWLQAQVNAEVGIWEVIEVEPGQSVTARNRLTGSERKVIEHSGSRTLVRHDHFVARVIEFEGASYLSGCLSRVLAPRHAEFAVERVRSALHDLCRLPKKRLLRSAELSSPVARWVILGVAGKTAKLAAEQRPILHNTDNELMILVDDTFRLPPGGSEAVRSAIGTLDRVEVVDESPRRTLWQATKAGNAQIKAWDNTIIGKLDLTGTTLTLSANSIARADRLRARVEAVCPPMEFVGRTQREPEVPVDGTQPSRRNDPAPPLEVQAVVRKQLESLYEGWWDHPLPALGNLSPREARRSADGQREVELLLREMEWSEQRKPAWQRYDVGTLRALATR